MSEHLYTFIPADGELASFRKHDTFQLSSGILEGEDVFAVFGARLDANDTLRFEVEGSTRATECSVKKFGHAIKHERDTGLRLNTCSFEVRPSMKI